MTSFSKYKAILWDFDGVLMDSMPIREKGFELVLKDFPSDQVRQLCAYHKKNGGLSRYVKFRYFFEEIRGEKVGEDTILNMAADFSEVMKKHLVDPSLLIEDSLDFVRKYYKNIPMYIVSGSDGQELNYLCCELEIANYFQSIHGSPTPKAQLIRDVMADRYNPADCVLIGDSLNDYEAALENGIDFIGYNNVQLQDRSPQYIFTFNKF